jgi:flavodoxin
MKSLVVYYSWTGNTEVAAKAIAAETSAELRALKEAKERRKASGFLSAAFGALTGSKASLKDPDYSTDAYDTIFIGTPIWAIHSTPPINTWIYNASLLNKNVYLFTTNASGKSQLVIDSLSKRVLKKGGTVHGSFSIQTERNQKVDTEKVRTRVKKWVKQLHLG